MHISSTAVEIDLMDLSVEHECICETLMDQHCCQYWFNVFVLPDTAWRFDQLSASIKLKQPTMRRFNTAVLIVGLLHMIAASAQDSECQNLAPSPTLTMFVDTLPIPSSITLTNATLTIGAYKITQVRTDQSGTSKLSHRTCILVNIDHHCIGLARWVLADSQNEPT